MIAQPLVSIALCTYNGERYLETQLQSLLNQTYAWLEILVLDDCSSDRTPEMLHRYAQADPRLQVIINEQNLGYVKNFEKAINLCTGDFIALADQDDVWELNKIETLLQEIQDAVLIYHDSALMNDAGKDLGRISDSMNMYAGDSPLPFFFYNCISGHSCLFKKELTGKLGSFSPQFHHDWWIAYVAANTGNIRYYNQPLVKYRQHQHSNTDILRSKKKEVKKRIKLSEINILWLKHCLSISGKEDALIERIIYLDSNRNAMNILRLLRLVLKHYRLLFYLKKKTVSKLNYMRKMVFFKRETYHTL